MERELRELQETLKPSEGQAAEKSPAILQSVSSDGSSPDIPESDYSLEHLKASLRDYDNDTLQWSIGDTELDAGMVADLLQE